MSLYKISYYETSAQALWKSSLGKIFVRDFVARSLYRSLEEVSWQDLLDKICIRDLLARYLYEICTRSLYQSSVGKISVRDLMARSLYKSLEEVSWQDLLDHTLCEPAQSKCTSTLHNRHQKSHFTLKLEYMSTFHKRHQKSHFIQKFTGKMPRPRLGPERGHTLCASLRSRNACPHFGPRMRTHTLCEPAQSKCMSTFHKRHQKSHFTQKFTGKMPRPRFGQKPQRRRCASLRHRNACQDFTRATLYGNLQEKCRGPEPRRTLCASLCSRNTCQDFTRATLCGNLQVKCRRPAWACEHPDQAPAFTLFVRTPQCGHTVWGMMLHSLFSETDIFEKCPRNRRLLRMIASETTQKHWKKQCKIHISWWGISHDFIQGMWVPENLGAAPSYVYVYAWYILLYVTKCCCLAFWKERKRIDRKTMTKTRLTKRIQNGKERYSRFGEICPTHCVCLSEFAAGPEGICGSGICANFFLASQDH